MKLYFLPITAVLLLAAMACSNNTDVNSTAESTTPDIPARTTPPPATLSPFEVVLSVVPDRPEHRNFVRLNNFGAIAKASGIQVPGANATFEEVYQFRIQVALEGDPRMFPSDDFLAGFSRNVGEDGADLKAGLGFDSRDVILSAVPGVGPSGARHIEVVFGEFDPDLTRSLLQTCLDCADAPQIVEYRGQTYFSWGGDGNAGQRLFQITRD